MVQAESLSNTHPCGRQEPDQGFVGCGAEERQIRQGSGGNHQPTYFTWRVQVGDEPPLSSWQQILARHFRIWIDGPHILSEAANHGKSLSLPEEAWVRCRLGPVDSLLSADHPATDAIEVVGELTEQPAVVDQLEPQATADGQVFVGLLAKGTHASPPAQGSASVERATESTVA